MPSRRLTGLGLETTVIKLDVVVNALTQSERAGRLGDLAGRVPGRARSELVLFKEHNIGPALVCEVISNTATHNTAADNDDAGG